MSPNTISMPLEYLQKSVEKVKSATFHEEHLGLEPTTGGMKVKSVTYDQPNARTVVTLSAVTCTKLYFLVTKAHMCEQLAQRCYLTVAWPGVKPKTDESQVRHPKHYIRPHMSKNLVANCGGHAIATKQTSSAMTPQSWLMPLPSKR